MDTARHPADRVDALRPETEVERVDWEANGIAEADNELASGLYVDAADMRAWIESSGSEHELPPPLTRRR